MTTNRPIKKLGEIAKTQSGGTPKREVKEFWGGKIPWLKSGELDGNLNINICSEYITEKAVENSSAKLFKKGTLVMAMYGATAGKLGILGMDATTNQAVCSIQNNKGLFDNMYVYYFLLLNREKIIQDSFGGAQPNISKGYIDDIPIPLPPLATQQLIVAKLDETFAQIDEAIATTQANIDQTDELTKSVLDKVFEEGEWEKIKLGSLCEIITGNTPPTQFKDYYGGKILWAGPSDFGDFKIVNSTNKTITEKGLKEGKARIIKKGSVMLVAIGATIGKVGIAGEDMTTNQQINTFETGSELHNEFLYYYFRKIRNFFLGMSSQTTLPILNKSQCKDIEIPLPPLAKQQEIVSYLDNVFAQSSQLKEQYQKKLVELKELKASVLQSAFEGKLV